MHKYALFTSIGAFGFHKNYPPRNWTKLKRVKVDNSDHYKWTLESMHNVFSWRTVSNCSLYPPIKEAKNTYTISLCDNMLNFTIFQLRCYETCEILCESYQSSLEHMLQENGYTALNPWDCI